MPRPVCNTFLPDPLRSKWHACYRRSRRSCPFREFQSSRTPPTQTYTIRCPPTCLSSDLVDQYTQRRQQDDLCCTPQVGTKCLYAWLLSYLSRAQHRWHTRKLDIV